MSEAQAAEVPWGEGLRGRIVHVMAVDTWQEHEYRKAARRQWLMVQQQ
jgi:hypothetical protein